MEQHNHFQSEVWLKTAKDLYNLQQQRKSIEKTEQELAQQLRSLQHNEPLSYGGIRYFYEERKGSVDYGSIPQLINLDLEPYRKSSVKVWKLVIGTVV